MAPGFKKPGTEALLLGHCYINSYLFGQTSHRYSHIQVGREMDFCLHIGMQQGHVAENYVR